MMQNGPTFAVFTFGCKVNQYETQQIREQLMRCGWEEMPQRPEICIINGCAVTGTAERKARQLVRTLRKKFTPRRIVLTGCAAGTLRQDLSCQPDVRIIPQRDKFRIPEICSDVSADSRIAPSSSSINHFSRHTRAFVKIQDGCDNFCAYCIVAHLRGSPVSKPSNAVMQEISQLSSCREIVFSGINLGSWGRDFSPKQELADLMRELSSLDRSVRLRLSSIELNFVTDGVLTALTDSRWCPHVHIPLQSGDDEVLRRMNRRYRAADYLDTIAQIRNRLPDCEVTTDIIVGFPGETDRQFERTLEMVRSIRFLRVHVFPYSRRPGTAAYGMDAQVSAACISRRQKLLIAEAERSSRMRRRALLGTRTPVLFERQAAPGVWIGYSGNYVLVSVASELSLQNQLRWVIIERLDGEQTWGRLSP